MDQQQLSLEQELELRMFTERVRNLSRQEAQNLLVDLYESMMVRENTYREIIKDAWGVGRNFKEALGINPDS